jgi:hypothetical protein
MLGKIDVRNQGNEVVFTIDCDRKEVSCVRCCWLTKPSNRCCGLFDGDNLVDSINQDKMLIDRLRYHDDSDNESIDDDDFVYNDEEELPFKYDTDSDSDSDVDSDVYDEIDYIPAAATAYDIFQKFMIDMNHLYGIKISDELGNEIYFSIAKLNQDQIIHELNKAVDIIRKQVKMFSDALYFSLRECNDSCRIDREYRLSSINIMQIINDTIKIISITREFIKSDFSKKKRNVRNYLYNSITKATFREIVELYPLNFHNSWL